MEKWNSNLAAYLINLKYNDFLAFISNVHVKEMKLKMYAHEIFKRQNWNKGNRP